MKNPPLQITIINNWPQGGLTVIAMNYEGSMDVEEGLAFDEMLGTVARLFVPTMSDGTPRRQLRRPLFLKPPQNH